MDWLARSDRYASIVASEQRVELFDRIGTLEQDNIRLRVMLGVERQRVDRLWRKRNELSQVRGLVRTINLNLPPQTQEAQVEALKKDNVKDENLHGMDMESETRLDRTLCIRSRSWLPRFRDLLELTKHESQKYNNFIHPGSDKIYHNLKQLYQWPNMERGIATNGSKCLMCLRIRDEYQKSSGLLVPPRIPHWKWEI
ncbi:putative reverse transcriptase domain-containing protein [Tanacetum coccineum]